MEKQSKQTASVFFDKETFQGLSTPPPAAKIQRSRRRVVALNVAPSSCVQLGPSFKTHMVVGNFRPITTLSVIHILADDSFKNQNSATLDWPR